MHARKKQQGVAIIEFALVLPLILLMIAVTTEFGRAMYEYGLLAKSVRDAARYLSVQTPGTHTTQARNLVVYGNTAGTGSPLAIGLTLSNVPTPTWQTAGTAPVINTVTIQVSGYTFNSMFGSVLGHTFGAIAFSDIRATMRSQL
jgi:Flp pilus assembly protein TadG